MRYAIVGSRDYPFLYEVKDYVDSLPDSSVIVSGGARGVDSVALQAARDRGMQTVVYLPDWDTYAKAAGMIRNKKIIDDVDVVVAFWYNESRGTKNSIDRALVAENVKKIIIFKR